MKIIELTGGWTPAKALLHASKEKYPFLLDGEGGPGRLGEMSLVGCDPFLVVHATGEGIRLDYPREGRSEVVNEHPFALMDRLLAKYNVEDSAPFPLANGGAVGYFSYDLFPLIEKITRTTEDDMGMPLMYFGFYDSVCCFDHKIGEAKLALSSGVDETDAKHLEFWSQAPPAEPADDVDAVKDYDLLPNRTPGEFMDAVSKAKEHIAAGDVYQVNLSQRFETEYTGSAVEFYLKLRQASPAPFGGCLFPDGFAVLSNSPERYLLIDGDYIETRPIKGTRPRGRTPEEDAQLAKELAGSEKDAAEHVMIVDLERNDLGRVCDYNTVHVPEFRVIESYANVHHLVSTVAGSIHPSRSIMDCIRNSFPGGSITGAPKVRAMELIDELETTARGVYCGSIGYMDFSGRVDLNIAIRTAVKKGDKLYFQVGGGIVADSDPQGEYDETITKSQSFVKALTGKGRVWDR